MTKKPTGVDPDPAQYAAFVRATVKYFSALPAGVGRPSSYSIWNEPNLGKGRFLKVTGTDGKDILSAGKYRQLYRLGYDAAQNGYCDANPGTSACTATPRHPVRVLIGELSEQPLRVREAVGGGTHQYTSLDYLYAALKPASNSATETTVADGLAVHPYQHRAAASSRGPIEQVGLGKLRGPLKPTGHTYRVGVRAAINDLFARMGTSGTDTTGPRWLKTPNSAAVSLYLTEFGYLNLLPKVAANTKPNRSAWRTEAARATAFTSNKGAFAIAQLAQARWLTLQALTESGSSTDANGTPNPPVDGNADFKGDFDTGLIAPGWQSNWSDAIGIRPYGKGPAQAGKPNGPFYTNFPQARTAYCAIYKKLKADGYPEQPTGVPCP
jgi:hypothetical protein